MFLGSEDLGSISNVFGWNRLCFSNSLIVLVCFRIWDNFLGINLFAGQSKSCCLARSRGIRVVACRSCMCAISRSLESSESAFRSYRFFHTQRRRFSMTYANHTSYQFLLSIWDAVRFWHDMLIRWVLNYSPLLAPCATANIIAFYASSMKWKT